MEIRLCTIDDLAFVNFVMKHPHVYASASHDHSLPVEDFSASHLLHGHPVYVLMDDSNSFVAVLVSENGVLFSSHQNVLPGIRGKKAVKICREMVQWMFDNTTCQKIIGYVPEPNKAARMFAKLSGFKVEHRLNNSYQENGRLYALDIVSVEKGR